MKKSTIWFLTIIMALTFGGLLYVQIMYMENMIRMRYEQFSEVVKRSLYNVSTTLERDETKHFLEQDLSQANISSVYDTGAKFNKYDYTISSENKSRNLQIDNRGNDGVMNDSYQTMQEELKGQYLYQKGLLNEVILKIINQSSNRPIEDRADSAVVKR